MKNSALRVIFYVAVEVCVHSTGSRVYNSCTKCARISTDRRCLIEDYSLRFFLNYEFLNFNNRKAFGRMACIAPQRFSLSDLSQFYFQFQTRFLIFRFREIYSKLIRSGWTNTHLLDDLCRARCYSKESFIHFISSFLNLAAAMHPNSPL